MKKILFLILTLSYMTLLNASPFGVKKGMTPEELGAVSTTTPLYSSKENAYSFTPIKSHPMLVHYYANIDKNVGLYIVGASTDYIKIDDYGTSIKDTFNNLCASISKTYGTPTITDTVLESGGRYHDESYWKLYFYEGGGKLEAVWPPLAVAKVDSDLIGIVLKATSTSYGEGMIMLGYLFDNASTVVDEQDSVF